MQKRREYATFCFIWRRTTQYRQEVLCGVILEWRKKKKKTSKSHMRIFVFYEYMQDNTENRQNVASYIEKRKNNNNEKKGIFMISYKKTDR